MIKAVLLDLDDTLIGTDTQGFFPLYLRELGRYAAERLPQMAPPEHFVQLVMQSFERSVALYDPSRVLYERFMDDFCYSTGQPEAVLAELFDTFYTTRYPELCPLIQPRPETPDLLNWLSANGYRIVVATNPGLPRTAILQRMAAGGIGLGHFDFELVTSIETMHFGKPHPAYYAEILLRLDLHPCEAIMVGDDWEGDILPAAEAGLHTFWIVEDGSAPPDRNQRPCGAGSYAQFVRVVQAGWLEMLKPCPSQPAALSTRLLASPAMIDTVCRGHSPAVLSYHPGSGEWSPRDIVCHLNNHEPLDRERLRRVLDEDNPFLSAVTRPWERREDCPDLTLGEALQAFIRERADTVAWLRTLDAAAWERPARDAIFGPTSFEELVRFVLAHDRTHINQMQNAIAAAMSSASPA